MQVLFMLCLLFGWGNAIHAQDYEWEIDRINRQKEAEQRLRDSFPFTFKNKLELKLDRGQWYFSDRVRSSNDESFFLSEGMNSWMLITSYYLLENLSLDASFGIKLAKEIPTRDAFLPITMGEEVEIEGYGAVFIPMDVGFTYYFLTNKLKPYLGINGGILVANTQHTLVTGNLTTGINRSENQTKDAIGFGRLHGGIRYQFGKRAALDLSSSQYFSKTYEVAMGGYERHAGLLIQLGYSLLLSSK